MTKSDRATFYSIAMVVWLIVGNQSSLLLVQIVAGICAGVNLFTMLVIMLRPDQTDNCGKSPPKERQ